MKRLFSLWLLCVSIGSLLPRIAGATTPPTTVSPYERVIRALPGKDAGIVDYYDATVAFLEKVCEDYRRIRAAELSLQLDIAYQEAYGNVQSVMPVLKPINRELLEKRITNPAEINDHKRQVELVESEVRNMVELAIRLLLEIEEKQAEPPPPVPIEIVHTAAMEGGAEEVVSGEEVVESTSIDLLAVKAKENENERAIDITAEMRAALSVPENLERTQLKGTRLTAKDLREQNFRISKDQYEFGRKVHSTGGRPMEWMFVDTWYTIGPFPNPQRVNIHTKFPPETMVNLGAAYPGKNGREVRWEFLQSGIAKTPPRHAEPYAIYYAYTELWFDEDVDLWIAVGSDDKSNLWINNLPVWISGEEEKKWRINEGFRKVYFKKGINRVLYRVENGPLGVYFSLGIQVLSKSTASEE
ncbi:MAG: hypothetical protein WD708_02060 [Kiritimatiellia bacterium]